jgi:hypothetical protein
MSVVFCSLFFVPCRTSYNAVKRDISITKGMELAQLTAEYVYYLLITEVLYERPAIKKEKKGKENLLVILLWRPYGNDKCVASDLNHNILHTRHACIVIFQL